MSIILGRIDYRLLHGIVATMWAPQSGAQRVMVIDDKTANDPIIKESMRLGKPAGMACSIITRNNKTEGTPVSSRASILDSQKEIYKKLIENGTKVDVQFTTTDKAEPLTSKISL